jgi:hypothetical protein
MTGSVCLRRHELALLPSRSAAGQSSVSGFPPDFTKRVAADCSINGLSLAEHMVENHPPRRHVYGREHAARIPDDRERRAQARRAAEALFAPEPPVTEKPLDRSPQRPHVLPTAPPPARSEVIQSTTRSR